MHVILLYISVITLVLTALTGRVPACKKLCSNSIQKLNFGAWLMRYNSRKLGS